MGLTVGDFPQNAESCLGPVLFRWWQDLSGPKAQPFTQPRATPWGSESYHSRTCRPNGPNVRRRNRWPVGPVHRHRCSPLPRASPWAGRTEPLLGASAASARAAVANHPLHRHGASAQVSMERKLDNPVVCNTNGFAQPARSVPLFRTAHGVCRIQFRQLIAAQRPGQGLRRPIPLARPMQPKWPG